MTPEQFEAELRALECGRLYFTTCIGAEFAARVRELQRELDEAVRILRGPMISRVPPAHIEACVAACAGMTDPAQEIARLREKAAAYDRWLKAAGART